MTACVLDCSIAAAWLFDDEASPQADLLLETIVNEGAVVPGLWHLEVSNVLIQAERRGRITESQILERLTLLGSLPIKTDDDGRLDTFAHILPLARQHMLTSYDAAYLELALRLKLPLATKDKALLKAASNAGAGVLSA